MTDNGSTGQNVLITQPACKDYMTKLIKYCNYIIIKYNKN